jgi:hypothetical protein
MLDDPEWAVYTVKSCDAFGQVRMMGATRSHDVSLAVWAAYQKKLPLEDVLLCHSPYRQDPVVRTGHSVGPAGGEAKAPAASALMAKAPTVAELKEAGAKGAIVSCRFCRHSSKLSFEQLRLGPDDVFAEAMARRKLRCGECRADKISFSLEWGPRPGGGLV